MAISFRSAVKPCLIRCAPHLLLVLVVMLPFAAGLASGQTFYFRDISRAFYPQRLYAVRGLLQGEIRHWNPLVHEGVPLFPLPIAYPIDILQTLMPSASGLSLLLSLHVPLGALGFYGLARHLFRSSAAAAIGGALSYALGGFFLSCLNLYVHLQAAAWSPFIVWSLLWSLSGSWRRVLLPSCVTAIGLSTSGVEMIAQALIVAIVVSIAHSRDRVKSVVRVFIVVFSAAALAAPVLLTVFSQIEGSDRAAGFPTEIVLSNSVYPLSLPQIIVADWHGPVSDLVNNFWGHNYFPDFPYFSSLYLGAIVVCLSLSGAVSYRSNRWLLVALTGLGLWLSLGRWSGVSWLVESVPMLHLFRFPSKAFFTVHLVASLLAASGLAALATGRRRAWITLLASSAALGSALTAALLLPLLLPRFTHWFARGFFPPRHSLSARMECLNHMISDSAIGGALALFVGLVALWVVLRRLAPDRAVIVVVAVVGVDLLRTGAGLNPMVPAESLRPSPAMRRAAAEMRAEGGRVLVCDPEFSPLYLDVRSGIRRHSLWTFRLFAETMTPDFNMNADLPTALSRDLTMMVPADRALPVEKVGCDVEMNDEVVRELRAAGVRHIVALMQLDHPDIKPVGVLSPSNVSPLSVHLHQLNHPLPLRFVARQVRPARTSIEASDIARSDSFLRSGGVAAENVDFTTSDAKGALLSVTERADSIALRVRAAKRTVVCLRDAYASGWKAWVNGRSAAVLRANGRHRAVVIEPGLSHVELEYHAPGLRTGLLIAVVTLAGFMTAFLADATRRRKRH